jgi:HPt (histidine-containing phosphotransfer) domain-containing protein
MNDTEDFMMSEAMERVDDDVDLLTELVDTIFETFDNNVATIRGALSSGSSNVVFGEAHSMKSAFGNLGAKRCYEICRSIEKCGKDNNLSDASVMLDDLVEAAGRFKTAVAAAFGSDEE